jgi:hypothetical protein
MNARLVGFPAASNPFASTRCKIGNHLTTLESHPCTFSRFNRFRFTSLRKNRGRGGPQSQNGNRSGQLQTSFVTSLLHCFLTSPHASRLFDASRLFVTSLLRCIFTSCRPRCFLTSCRALFSSPQSHTFLRGAVEFLHISIPSANSYPFIHSDSSTQRNNRQRYKHSTKLRTRAANSFVTPMCRSFGPGPRSISYRLLLPCSRRRSFARISRPIHPRRPRIPLRPHILLHPHTPQSRYQPKTTSNLPAGGRPSPPLPFLNLWARRNARSATRRLRAHKP